MAARRRPWSGVAVGRGAGVVLEGLLVGHAPAMLSSRCWSLRLDGMGLPVVGVMELFVALAAGLLVPELRRSVPAGAGCSAAGGWCPRAPSRLRRCS
jgi:hypothetical protein